MKLYLSFVHSFYGYISSIDIRSRIFVLFVINIALICCHVKVSHLLFDTEAPPIDMLPTMRGNALRAVNDVDNWACVSAGPGFAYARKENNALVVHVTSVNGSDEGIRFYQEGVDLKPGKTYVLRFCARADEPTSALVKASKDSSDYRNVSDSYNVGLHQRIKLEPQWHAYCYFFEANKVTARHSRVPIFCLGHREGRVWLSSVVLSEARNPVGPFRSLSDSFYADSIRRQCDYIVDCSWSKWCSNHSQAVRNINSSAYGVLNDVRINADKGRPDYVRPGEASMGVIGLMAGLKALERGGKTYSPAEGVRYLGATTLFFEWADHAQNSDGSYPNAITYDASGNEDLTRRGGKSIGVTAQIVIAEYKRFECFNDVQWLRGHWGLAKRAGTWLLNQPSNGQTLDLSYRCAALRCLAAWAVAIRQPDLYSAPADADVAFLWGMADASPMPCGFFSYTDGAGRPTHNSKVDNICFAPFESSALNAKASRPGDITGTPFASLISDWWTQNMTRNKNPSHGTLLTRFDSPNVWNSRLSPGGSLELAKVEWRVGRRDRARARFDWVAGTADLIGRGAEAGTKGGIIDWLQVSNQFPDGGTDIGDSYQLPKGTKTPLGWERFIDTSAYFIEVARMLWQHQDTQYVPENDK